MPSLPTGSIDYIFTDPPFGISYHSRSKTRRFGAVVNDDLPRQALLEFYDQVFCEMARVLKRGSVAHVCSGWSTADIMLVALRRHFHVQACIVWDKMWPGTGWYVRHQHEFIFLCFNGKPPLPEKPLSDVWRFKRLAPSRMIHKNQKPVELVQEALQSFRSVGIRRVMDPFAGSGTTAEACFHVGLDFIGWELDPDNHRAALRRLESLRAHSGDK